MLGAARADARDPATIAFVSDSRGKWEGDCNNAGREGGGVEAVCANGGLHDRNASEVS